VEFLFEVSFRSAPSEYLKFQNSDVLAVLSFRFFSGLIIYEELLEVGTGPELKKIIGFGVIREWICTMIIKKLTLSFLLVTLSAPVFAESENNYHDSFVASVVLSRSVFSARTVKETKLKDTVLVLNQGQKFHIGWYEENIKSWRLNDVIRVELIGGWTAPVNPYRITNESAEKGKRVLWGSAYRNPDQ